MKSTRWVSPSSCSLISDCLVWSYFSWHFSMLLKNVIDTNKWDKQNPTDTASPCLYHWKSGECNKSYKDIFFEGAIRIF
jgi:hypothetical protein